MIGAAGKYEDFLSKRCVVTHVGMCSDTEWWVESTVGLKEARQSKEETFAI